MSGSFNIVLINLDNLDDFWSGSTFMGVMIKFADEYLNITLHNCIENFK